MLLNILTRLLRALKPHSLEFDLRSKKADADAYYNKGKLHEAIELYRECVAHDRFNVELLNSLGACLDDIGDDDGGRECFELAYSIDDTYIAGVVNYAKKLADEKETERALALLEYVHVCEPDYNHIFPIYAAVCFSRGWVERAVYFYRKGWFGGFDSLRMANAYLFALAYFESEQNVASEHRFWAETLRDVNLSEEFAIAHAAAGEGLTTVLPLPSPVRDGRKLRIGYWSPDLRGHSVSYFFRPLLENHDRSRYEIFVYHDSFKSDGQTDAIKTACDHYHDVYLLNDIQLYALMRSHQLDILVEMAGHTSANRLLLLKNNRFADLQISGIGYPPTTGISQVDAKIVDASIYNDNAANYYAERPMVLPSSFWCFDPMGVDEGVIADLPPVDQNGYITFACVGNISKINDRILSLWIRILEAVPSSRLLIRSISFEDPLSQKAMEERLRDAGLNMSRVDLKCALGGSAFYNSYNEIDIILDTFPFNGGTTTCFATYMGVPVISRAGDSLISRMGLSAMVNLGAAKWVASDEESYVANAILAATDVQFLREFKSQARARFRSSPLGNGRLFAADFEKACESFLNEKGDAKGGYHHTIPTLPPVELMRRVYAVWRSGNGESAVRILNHCLAAYPEHGGAHLFIAMQMAEKGMMADAVAYLTERLEAFGGADQVSAMISIIRWQLLTNDTQQAKIWLKRAMSLAVDDRFDSLQLRLYEACLMPSTPAKIEAPLAFSGQRFVVLVPCDDLDYFQAIEMRLRSLCRVPGGCSIIYARCPEQARGRYYQKWLTAGEADVLIIMQRVVEIVNPDFYAEVLRALLDCDIVGVAGATRWERRHWRGDKFEVKTAGFLTESREADGFLELQCLGVTGGSVVTGQSVLDGVMLALRLDQVTYDSFDDELGSLNWAMEEDWTHDACKAGARLAVHRNLGVLVHEMPPQDRKLGYPGLLRLQEKYNFPLFQMEHDDGMVLTLPLTDSVESIDVMWKFCLSN